MFISFADMTAQVPLYANGSSACLYIFCCYISTDGTYVFTAFALTYCLLAFPPCICVLYLVLQRWWQQRSSCSTAVTSPPDIVTYHAVGMTVLGVSGSLALCYGSNVNNSWVVWGGSMCWLFAWYGETLFQILACLEHYLALAHPIMYQKLRGERGIFLRNISSLFVWLFAIARTSASGDQSISVIFDFVGLVLSLITAVLYNFFLLQILIRPTPGKQSREGMDQTKQRALFIIVTITGTLCLRFSSNLILYGSFYITGSYSCVSVFSMIWFNIPSSLILPLLFLHRAGKLACCKQPNG